MLTYCAAFQVLQRNNQHIELMKSQPLCVTLVRICYQRSPFLGVLKEDSCWDTIRQGQVHAEGRKAGYLVHNEESATGRQSQLNEFFTEVPGVKATKCSIRPFAVQQS